MSPFRRLIYKTIAGFSIAVGAGTTFYFLRQNDYEVSHLGIIRFARVGTTASSIFVDYKWSLWNLDPNLDEYKKQMKGCHQRSAEKLLNLAKANGGVFIKVGQHIASLQYILPTEYTSTLSVLHSKAPESDLADVKNVFRESLQKELEDVFSYFNTQPYGAASLAQVYEARLKTGERVAVKIQHPKVKERSYVDMKTMEYFVRVGHWLFPEFRLMWLVDAMKRNLPNELDFLQEGYNADRVRRMFAHLDFLKIPKIYYDLSSDKVLTMEFCDGAQINDLKYFEDNKIDKHDFCRKLGRLYSQMIFVNGYIHCDPHPGNVLIKRDKNTGKVEIILLDHGLYTTLPDDFRINYAQLWLAILKPDKDEIQICQKMGVGHLFGLFTCMVTARSWASVTEGVNKTKATPQERKEIQNFAASLVEQISQVLDVIPKEMLLILKTNDLLRSIEHRLGTQNRSDGFLEMSRNCAITVYEDAIKNSTSIWQRFTKRLSLYWILSKIAIYEYFVITLELIRLRS